MPKATIIHGDIRTSLKNIPDKSVQCVITSPPYWGLRDYGTASWEGGNENCSHKRDSKWSASCTRGQNNLEGAIGDGIYKSVCKRCGALRIDNQLGLEETPDLYVANLVSVFRDVRRLLKDDGTVWLNLGDSYNSFKVGNTNENVGAKRHNTDSFTKPLWNELKPKDLIGIPFRVAFALQADGWYMRQDIIWSKPNPMPESVTDRCTKSHEYLFLLSKESKYFYDYNAIKEPAQESGTYETRNKRSVWSIPVKPFKEAHFAVMPELLVEPCVMAGSKEGDLILDPFTGSGTVAVVALRHNRNFIGVELNEKYIEIANQRITSSSPLFNIVEIQN